MPTLESKTPIFIFHSESSVDQTNVQSAVVEDTKNSTDYSLYVFGISTTEQRFTVHIDRVLVLDTRSIVDDDVLFPKLDKTTTILFAQEPFMGKVAYGRVYDRMITDKYACIFSSSCNSYIIILPSILIEKPHTRC